MREEPKLEIRRKIYRFILKNPGTQASKIAEILKISGQLADYHLIALEESEIISSVKEEGYRRYYVKGKIGSSERKRISILRQENPLKIVLYLLRHPYSKHKDILEDIDISKSTLSYHLNKLVKYEIVSVGRSGPDKVYVVTNPREITQLLVKYKPYSRIETLKDTWVDLKWPGK